MEREFDYYTAVDDDLGPEDEPGADMIGQIEFNSATFYRYAVLDINKLLDNLQGDRELALSAIEAFATAFVRAVPTGAHLLVTELTKHFGIALSNHSGQSKKQVALLHHIMAGSLIAHVFLFFLSHTHTT